MHSELLKTSHGAPSGPSIWTLNVMPFAGTFMLLYARFARPVPYAGNRGEPLRESETAPVIYHGTYVAPTAAPTTAPTPPAIVQITTTTVVYRGNAPAPTAAPKASPTIAPTAETHAPASPGPHRPAVRSCCAARGIGGNDLQILDPGTDLVHESGSPK